MKAIYPVPEENRDYCVLGVMSGTSLDGVDLALCRFRMASGKWTFQLIGAMTISYDDYWFGQLKDAPTMNGYELVKLHFEYGILLGNLIRDWIKDRSCSPDLLAVHGHTVFHRPHQRVTFQIGNGAEIAFITGIPVVCDFRTQDVTLGGQGAPLVPLGDKMLFGEYQYCLNLGGFSNVSFDEGETRKAFDICPVNIVLNHLARLTGIPYDQDGSLAASGKVVEPLLKALNNLPFYQKAPPKSLGREWVENEFLPVLRSFDSSITDQLRTVTEHIAIQISRQTRPEQPGKMLVTGGGAKNRFLISRLQFHSPHQLIIPEENIVDFKEAIIFAFLGLLRWFGLPNCLSSVTGAARDHSSGVIYLP